MPRILKDLTGRRFGRLTVVGLAAKHNNRHTVWRCECACGQKRDVAAASLIGGYTKSCGCLRSEKSAARMRAAQKRAMAKRKRVEPPKPAQAAEEQKTWRGVGEAIADLAAALMWV